MAHILNRGLCIHYIILLSNIQESRNNVGQHLAFLFHRNRLGDIRFVIDLTFFNNIFKFTCNCRDLGPRLFYMYVLLLDVNLS